jgi:hypothetical protein
LTSPLNGWILQYPQGHGRSITPWKNQHLCFLISKIINIWNRLIFFQLEPLLQYVFLDLQHYGPCSRPHRGRLQEGSELGCWNKVVGCEANHSVHSWSKDDLGLN